MFDDVGKTIKAILYDRITSPLFGTFIFSWCGWNWRLLALFLTDSSTIVVKKLQYVDSDIYPGISEIIVRGFLLPATTTAFFIYIYPWFAKKVYGHWREQQNELKKLQVEKDGEKPLTKEEAQKIRNQALLSELQYQDEREKRETRIKDLESIVKSLQAENNLAPNRNPDSLNSPIIPQRSQISPTHDARVNKEYSREVKEGMFSVLRMVDSLAPGESLRKDIFMQSIPNDSELSKMETTFVLHCLDNLVEEQYVQQAGSFISVLPKGRAALVHNSFE